MIAAYPIQELTDGRSNAFQVLYRVSEPVTYDECNHGTCHKTTDYVVVSAVPGLITGIPQTYIFPADSKGEFLSLSTLPGSFDGAMNHAEAINGAGWELVIPL